ncbi:methylcrotonoyl-CoA carboxylase subunit alpha, mitochondrial [Anabrus simplex]|uniref:methylcrotonoyl-CoA carboxylase subunit alpha, mitochondrial n=1 Tax=Anabrus simplex TaxID=316456 RepID=UPI0035A2E318
MAWIRLKNGNAVVYGYRHILKYSTMPIRKVLIANRGEIACRVMRTAKKMGIQSVAVYSDADARAMHVELADEAYHIGPAASQDSYLCQEKILKVAGLAGCQAIHPGYGFLSENAEFAEECQKSGVIFIGPPASAIRDMGIKSTSKAIMAAAGVPIIEGYHGEDQSLEKLHHEAERIGFPLMIKAVRGGGGKGMRIARNAGEFKSQLESAQRESLKAFGDQAVLLEKFVEEPRHVEVQIFGDQHGNCVHLFERDCSVQRRHQKIIEEAPAPGLSSELRSELGRAAVRAAQAVGYVGAGTVEFILDCRTHAFHFMEMNTRLQVEHPITEMVTGTDLVQWQLQVASGEPLPLKQEDIQVHGHSFEARIYAESPRRGFLPGAGPLVYLDTPPAQVDVRIETGVVQGDEVSVYYDPMIAKLVVWGENRAAALLKLQANLAEYNVVGLDTNVDFLMDLSKNEDFGAGKVHTGFIEQHQSELFPERPVENYQVAQAVLALILNEQLQTVTEAMKSADPFSPFALGKGVRFNHWLVRSLTLTYGEQAIPVEITYLGEDQYSLDIRGTKLSVMGSLLKTKDGKLQKLKCIADGVIHYCKVAIDSGNIHLFNRAGSWTLSMPETRFDTKTSDASSSAGAATVPMPGVVDKVFVTAGQKVVSGDPLLVVIAMKMEHVIRAPRDARIDKVLCQAGDNVPKNSTLVTFCEDR